MHVYKHISRDGVRAISPLYKTSAEAEVYVQWFCWPTLRGLLAFLSPDVALEGVDRIAKLFSHEN